MIQVKVFMGDGWKEDFSKTHFDNFSPPDFYTRVIINIYLRQANYFKIMIFFKVLIIGKYTSIIK